MTPEVTLDYLSFHESGNTFIFDNRTCSHALIKAAILRGFQIQNFSPYYGVMFGIGLGRGRGKDVVFQILEESEEYGCCGLSFGCGDGDGDDGKDPLDSYTEYLEKSGKLYTSKFENLMRNVLYLI